MEHLLKEIKSNKVIYVLLFLIILIVGIFLRSYNAVDWFAYAHDQDIAGWIIRDILQDRHLRLIGQETSSRGVFIGPLFYYLQIPFYFLFDMDPVGSLLLPIILGSFGIFSYYFVFSKLFNKNTGFVASFFYALSNYVVFVDREVAPTMPIMLWSVWFFYSLNLILKKNQNGWIFGIGLLGLAWHINMGLAILTPLLFLAQYLSKKKLDLKKVFIGGVLFVVLMSPFFVFESRHGFNQVKAITGSLTSDKDYISNTSKGIEKVNRVLFILKKNTNGLLFGDKVNLPFSLGILIFTSFFIFLYLKGRISKSLTIIAASWQLLYIVFFTFNPINPSEYYFNGMNVIWIFIFSFLISYLFDKRKNTLAFLILGLFASFNLYSFIKHEYPRNGYLERTTLINFIEKDSKERGYPCVAISYIVSPGHNLGYRYLFFLKGLHVEKPDLKVPVYSIVFPQSLVNKIDKSFGALGLILPDYQRYTIEEVKRSCSGKNSNITDPIFGFTK